MAIFGFYHCLSFNKDILPKWKTRLETKFANVKHCTNVFPVKTVDLTLIFRQNLVHMLFSKMLELEKVRKRLQVAYIHRSYNPDFQFLDARKEINLTRVVSSFSNEIRVSWNQSFVYVPYNIFDRSEEILIAAEYTKKLDEVFIENRDQDETTTWQHFGSVTGIWRNFPGLWKDTYT